MFDRVANYVLVSAGLLTLIMTGKSSFVEKPVDTEVKIGDSTYFNCSLSNTSADIFWYHSPVGGGANSQKYVYFQGHMMKPYDIRFKIEKVISLGSFNLVISSVELQDAGTYICQDGGTDNSMTAMLIVLETNPVCTSNIDDSGFIGPNDCGLKHDTIHLSCSIDYKGNECPELMWATERHGRLVPLSGSSGCSGSESYGRVSYNYSVESDIEFHRSSFICQTSKSRTTKYQCRTDVAKIHHAVGKKSPIVKNVGDTFVCSVRTSSDGCSYTWIRIFGTDEEAVSESNGVTFSKHGRYQCKAKCLVKDIQCSFDAMMVEVYTGTEAKDVNTNAIVGGTLGFALLVCLIIAMAGYFYRKSKAKKRKLKGWEEKDQTDADETEHLRMPSSAQRTENFIYENLSYTKEFEQIATITTGADSVISGITVLSNKLYVVHERHSTIEVYDSKTLTYEINSDIEQQLALNNPLDITASESSKCLYVADLQNGRSQCVIIKRLDVSRKSINTWSIDGNECRMSMFGSNAIICLAAKNQITEYSPDGIVVYRVTLYPNDGFDKLLHAIKIAESRYAVSHTEPHGNEHRVSIIERANLSSDQSSVRIVYATTIRMCCMNIPICLARYGQGCVLVADRLNSRVLLIDVNKNACEELIRDGRIRNLLSQCKLEHHPIRMCLDESNGTLFVALGDAYLEAGIISTFKEQDINGPSTSLQANRPSYFASACISCTKRIEHIAELHTKVKSNISGITILRKMLYVVHENCSTIEVYYSITFESLGSLDIRNYMTNPLDITSSEKSNSLFVVDLPNDSSQCRIKRLDLSGDVLNHWFIEDNMCRLSACESNVVACLANKVLIQEFSSEGDTICSVCLASIYDFGKLLHAIKVEDSTYAVSHTVPQSDEHRVSIIRASEQNQSTANDLNSVMVLFSTSPRSCGLNVPICLVEDVMGRIIVAEYLNNRVLLINTANGSCEVLLRDGRLSNLRSHCTIEHHPVRMCLDKNSGRIFVAVLGDYLKSGIISAFKLQDISEHQYSA